MSRDFQKFPNDDNGNVLWQMVEDGGDLSQPHEIEFILAFKTLTDAQTCALYLLDQEQRISLAQDEQTEPNEWQVSVYILIEPDYEDIVDLETWFTKIATEFQGEYAGWECSSYFFDVYDDEEE
ncbi:ribonuclease E inhibitor RraB [Acinetobacter sp. MD2]|uniref:ribonuclease E inhibitor RraB n=1 Tax=Acinetobacter sp. MD2 TaxID=2600066 RepID=UPI002D1E5E96|nr:ribonuclease E inhibitor RraB [Acinetobacter sp. MD2]MEB3766691.1 ribonuclease E inhibitor RraB [Acinetobacter sp. MD2]